MPTPGGTLRVAGRGFPVISHYEFRDDLIIEASMFPFDTAALLSW
jgi:hypothetical protein